MKIRVKDIPAKGMKVLANAAGDEWFRGLLRDSLKDAYGDDTSCDLSLNISNTVETISISGVINIDMKPTCSLCLKEFSTKLEAPVKIILSPAHEVIGGEDSIDEGGPVEEDDENFSMYHGDEIDLSGIVREQIILALPMRYICTEGCKGLCPHCGKNLNEGPCGCKPREAASQFSALKGFRPPR